MKRPQRPASSKDLGNSVLGEFEGRTSHCRRQLEGGKGKLTAQWGGAGIFGGGRLGKEDRDEGRLVGERLLGLRLGAEGGREGGTN